MGSHWRYWLRNKDTLQWPTLQSINKSTHVVQLTQVGRPALGLQWIEVMSLVWWAKSRQSQRGYHLQVALYTQNDSMLIDKFCGGWVVGGGSCTCSLDALNSSLRFIVKPQNNKQQTKDCVLTKQLENSIYALKLQNNTHTCLISIVQIFLVYHEIQDAYTHMTEQAHGSLDQWFAQQRQLVSFNMSLSQHTETGSCNFVH